MLYLNKKSKWWFEDTLQIAEERREAKGKGERERYTQRIEGEIRSLPK